MLQAFVTEDVGGDAVLGMYINQNNFSEEWTKDEEDADGKPVAGGDGVPDLIQQNGDDLTVTEALPDSAQTMRIIFDELLNGETVEQFYCACSNCPNNIEASLDPTMCADDPDTNLNELGQFADLNGDGLPDRAQMLAGVVTVFCDDAMLYASAVGEGFYNPSGNQDVPVATGLAGLGPAIVYTASAGLKTDANCRVAMGAGVKDKDGNAVEALPTDKTFHTSKLDFLSTPANNAISVDVKVVVNLKFNAILDEASLANIKLEKDVGGTRTTVAATPALLANQTSVDVTPGADLEAATKYVLTVPATVTDAYGGKATATEITFTTK